jgi:signal peptidase II
MPPTFRIFLAFFLPLLALDQVTKIWVRGRLDVGEAIPVFEGWFRIWYRTNTGAAWSFLGEHWWGVWVLSVVALIATVVMGVSAWRLPKEDRLMAGCLGALASGATGNMVDRLLHQRVTDFLDVYAESGPVQRFFRLIAGGNHYPTFNVADISIVCAAIVVMLMGLQKPPPPKGSAGA